MSSLRVASLLLLLLASLAGCKPATCRIEPGRPWNLVLDLAPEIPDREQVQREVQAHLRAELGPLLAPAGSPATADLRLEIHGVEADSMGYLARFGGFGLLGATLLAIQGRGWDGLAYTVLGAGAAGAWMITSLTRGILRSVEESRLGYQPLRFQGRLTNSVSGEQVDLTRLGLRKLHRPLSPEAAKDPVRVRGEAIHALALGVAHAVK